MEFNHADEYGMLTMRALQTQKQVPWTAVRVFWLLHEQRNGV